MSLRPWLLAAPAVVGLAAAAWLYRENRALEAELAAARRAGGEGAVALADASSGANEADAPARRAGDGARGALGGILRGLGGSSARERPTLPEPARESRGERRRRGMEELRAMLGREAGESADDYRARVLPLVTAALTGPRMRMEEARREAEKAAGVTDQQRAQIDALFDDVIDETLALTNQAIAGGDLTPYERNISGMLSWGGGLGAILGSTQSRIGGILGPEQQQILTDQGFEWGEYLGTRVPWERLEPPPPPGEAGDEEGGS
jgi:hypothetical protein